MSRYEKYLKIQERRDEILSILKFKHHLSAPTWLMAIVLFIVPSIISIKLIELLFLMNDNLFIVIGFVMVCICMSMVSFPLFFTIRFIYDIWITSYPFYFDIDIKKDIEFDKE